MACVKDFILFQLLQQIDLGTKISNKIYLISKQSLF